ncbi:MAG TPA: PEGA domain-containing protein [Bryobacteraceae bacterium]
MGPQNLNPLDELHQLDQQVEQVTDLSGLKPIFFRLEEIAKDYPNDFQVQLAVGDIKQHLVNRGTRLKQTLPAAPPPLSAGPPPVPSGPPTMPLPPPMMPPPMAAAPPPFSAGPPMPPPVPAPSANFPASPPPMPPAPMPPPSWEPSPDPAAPLASSIMPVASSSAPPPMYPPEASLYSPEASTGNQPPPYAAGPPPMMMPPEPPPIGTSQTGSAQTGPAPAGPSKTASQRVPAVGTTGPSRVAPPPKPPVNWKRALMMGGIAGALIAILAVGFVLWKRKHQQTDVASAEVPVEITTTPPGASVKINGEQKCNSDCKLSLAPGNYQVTAFLDGYEPAASGITVAATGGQTSFSLALEPQAQSLRILTDLPQGKIALDDQPPADLQDGQFTVDKIQPGMHTVKVTAKTGEASFSFEIAAAKMPSITGPVTAKNLSAVMVASLGNQAHVVTNAGPLKLQVNGQAEADVSPAGTDLKTFQPGVDELIVGEGKDQRSVKESFGPAPMLTAFLRSDLNIGTLIVATGKEDGVRVFVNNREQPQKTKGGLVRIQTIGPVSVRVMKEGFDQPPVQTAEVKKGVDTRLDFTLKAAPQFSTLQITGGTPGAEVVIDQRSVGVIGPDGTFTSGGLTPGDHVVGIRRDQYSPRQLPRTFRAGQTITISGPDAVLTAERVQAPPQPANKQTPPPPAPKQVATAPPAPTPGTMADWEDNSVWRQENGVFMHQGAAFIPYKMTPQGTFTFTVQMLKGGNLFRGGRIKWAVNRTDDKNYARYEMDDKNFWANVVSQGKKLERTHIPLKDLDKQKSFTVQIDVMPDHIVHKLFTGGEWTTLDSWAETGRNFSQGKFGFIVEGNDEIGISEFKFQPR